MAEPVAVGVEVIEALTVPFADTAALPDETCAVVELVDRVAKPELGVTLGAGVATTVVVVLDEEGEEVAVVGVVVWEAKVAVAADALTSYWLTMGAISWTTRLASASRKLVAAGWSDEGRAVTQDGRGAHVVVI